VDKVFWKHEKLFFHTIFNNLRPDTFRDDLINLPECLQNPIWSGSEWRISVSHFHFCACCLNLITIAKESGEKRGKAPQPVLLKAKNTHFICKKPAPLVFPFPIPTSVQVAGENSEKPSKS